MQQKVTLPVLILAHVYVGDKKEQTEPAVSLQKPEAESEEPEVTIHPSEQDEEETQ